VFTRQLVRCCVSLFRASGDAAHTRPSARCSVRLASHEREIEQHLLVPVLLARPATPDLIHQEVDGSAGHLGDRLADGRELRPDRRRQRRVVESAHGKIPRNIQTATMWIGILLALGASAPVSADDVAWATHVTKRRIV